MMIVEPESLILKNGPKLITQKLSRGKKMSPLQKKGEGWGLYKIYLVDLTEIILPSVY